MKTLKKIIFVFAVVVGLTFSVSAQKGDQKGGRPPKEKPPTVDPGNKNTPPPRGNPPKEKPGKPGMAFIAAPNRNEELG